MSGVGQLGYDPAGQQPKAALALRRSRQRDVARAYARRFRRVQLVPAGTISEPPLTFDQSERVTLQKDFLNLVGDHGSQTPNTVEVQVTRDADGGMRMWGDIEVHLACKNTSGASIAKGTPVYATGTLGSTATIEVAAADAANAAKMLAIGVLDETLGVNAFGTAIATGVIRQVNTAAYTVGQVLYVAPGGGLTGTRPTTSTHKVQSLARVVRAHATTGELLVLATAAQEFTIGTGLSLSGSLLTATGGGGGGTGNTYFPSGW